MSDNRQTSQVVFFFGAGASIAAGVPDTHVFVREFKESIHDSARRKTVERIIETLEAWKGKEIDVELLLETLTKLDAMEDEPLLKFFEGGDFILSEYSPKTSLIEELKDFIKTKAIVPSDRVLFLSPLLRFVGEFRPLDIISVNYDICVEQFCNVHKLTYHDGFDVYWNPKVFAVEGADIRLYKMHGSVMWYQSDRGSYIKLPVMTGKSEIKLITGEKAENLMLYPMQKWNYAEPLLELLVEIKHLLESETCKFLVVVGYSFRDDHIRRMLWDVARKNRDLQLVLVDPNAHHLYDEKLKYYDRQRQIPSSWYERVVCLPYKFEEVFPYLKNYYIKNLRDGSVSENSQRKVEAESEKANWMSPLRVYVKAEHTEAIVRLAKIIDSSEIMKEWPLNLELPFRMFMNLSAGGKVEEASSYFDSLWNTLQFIMVERFAVRILRDPQTIELQFNQTKHDSGGESCLPVGFLKPLLVENFSEFVRTRKGMITRISNDMQRLFTLLDSLKNYIEPFDEKGIQFVEYLELRKHLIDDSNTLKEDYQNYVKDNSDESRGRVISKVKKIEKSLLNEIFKSR
ncbi:SIR2 family protein [candidate division KSB1 bacterium]|nr:SIR2 family protein [candidate division KSB1 bacterium]